MDIVMNVVMDFALIIMAGLTGIGYLQWIGWKKEESILDYSIQCMKAEQEEQRKEYAKEQEKIEEQKDKPFYLDIILHHGSSIGAFASVNEDGSRRKGILSLNRIKLFGQNQLGQDYSYYIDEPGVEIWSTNKQGEVLLRSSNEMFEIRQEGIPRDRGEKLRQAILKKGIWYYVILESKHEIKIQAVEGI